MIAIVTEESQHGVEVHRGALHEAGHVIVAWHFGLKVTSIYVDNGPHGSGMVSVDDDHVSTPAEIREVQITYAAGDAARSYVIGDPTPEDIDRNEIINRGVPAGCTEEDYLRQMRNAAIEILDQHERELAALAWELDKADLTPDEALAVITSPERVTSALMERDANHGVPQSSPRSNQARSGTWSSLFPNDGSAEARNQRIIVRRHQWRG